MKEEKYGRHRNNSYPMHYHREPLPMFYITLLSSSSGGSMSESPDFKRKQDNRSKKNEDSGAMFQCQELDGGNAIECKTTSFTLHLDFSYIIEHRNVIVKETFLIFIFPSDIPIVSYCVRSSRYGIHRCHTFFNYS